MARTLYAGGCRCGAVRYEISSEPLDVTHCHCEICRGSAAAPFLTWMALSINSWHLKQGDLRAYRSSEQGERSFCPACGCQVLFRFEAAPDKVFVTAGSLDDPEQISPTNHSYVTDGLRWIHVDDDLPQFEGAPRYD